MRASRSIASERDVPFERISERVGRVGIPLPFFSVPVNVWIVLAERPLLVDAGPRTDEARARVEAGLAAMGSRPDDIGWVFVTHHHVDHSGLLHEWIARSKATALVHEDDLAAALDVGHATTKRIAGYREAARRWGMSDDMAEKVASGVEWFRKFGGVTPADRARPVAGERTPLEVPGISLTAIHAPGHTEGQALLWDEEARVLYSGDHVLERVTPNPNVYVPLYRGRWTGLAHYVASLEALRALPRDTTVHPGHGASFGDLHARIDETLEHHRARRDQVLAKLEPGPRTVIEIAFEIWDDLGPRDVALAAREVHGHLDLLEEEGLVARELEGEAWKFRRAS
jgi:glyoxylase-like metal-dependent hydrolase (beta-lactamase superfamily II)